MAQRAIVTKLSRMWNTVSVL